MSKHLGNILEPMPLMDEHGADARAVVHGVLRLALVGPAGRVTVPCRRSSARCC